MLISFIDFTVLFSLLFIFYWIVAKKFTQQNIFILLVFALLFVACKNDKKGKHIQNSDTNSVKQQEIKIKEVSLKESKNYPFVENIFDKLDYIFDYEFYFDQGIVINRIGLLKTKEHIYKFVFVLGDEADLKLISDLEFGMMFYPSDPSLLETDDEKQKGFIKTGVATKIKIMSEKYVFIHDEFKIIPKNHKTIRFYFYDKQGNIVGDNLFLNNISFRE